MLRLRSLFGILLLAVAMAFSGSPVSAAEPPLTVVVMDPLAAPLACACVKGFAQRRYDHLAVYLEKRLGRRTSVIFAEDLAGAIRRSTRPVDLIIGKDALVRFDATELKRPIRPLARLTGEDGATTLTGLFVVPAGDRAKKLTDLKGYRIVFGPEASAEKHSAAIAAIRKAGLSVPDPVETSPSCTEAAYAAIENKKATGVAAVISSYAKALMEGCGSIDPGDLRVIGRTDPVPFVTVFATKSVSADAGKEILAALLAVKENPALLTALESKEGFVSAKEEPPADKSTEKSAGAAWPQWRSSNRHGIVASLPANLDGQTKVLWKQTLGGPGLAGIAATQEVVIVADRDAIDQNDVFRCLDAQSGEPVWTLQYRAMGDLDYGNSPRATPLIHRDKVYLLGAFGHLNCVALADGKVLWKTHLPLMFDARVPIWGMCASPLIVDDKLIINPGGKATSLVALDPATGKEVWRTAGNPAAYSSFIVAKFGGVRQIVGYDSISLGGWDPATGKRLWTLIPPEDRDFNVPTPIDVDGRLLVTTENNGTRLYEFDDQGKIIPIPIAQNMDLAPDSSTPVVIDGRVFGCWGDLFCLDLSDGLKPLWTAEDDLFTDYVSIIGDRERILVTGCQGEVLLISAAGEEYKPISRVRIFGKTSEVLSHPALVGNRLYIRGGAMICCVLLDAK